MMFTASQLANVEKNKYRLREVSLVNADDCEMLDISRAINPMDEKNYIKFIYEIERYVRGSYEYKEYVKFLKESQGQGRCVFLGVVDYESDSGRLELHHAPFTLFDIVDIVARKLLAENKTLRTFEVVEQVLVEHQNGRVGLVPLSKTCHQLVHDGQLFIPLDYIYGDYNAFLEEYADYVTASHKHILKVMQEVTAQYNRDPNVIPEVLQTTVGYHGN